MLYLLTNLAADLTEMDLAQCEIAAQNDAVSCGDAGIDSWLGARGAFLAEVNFELDNYSVWMAEIWEAIQADELAA